MALQANIVVIEEPVQTEAEVVQQDIINLLSQLSNGNPNQLSDLVELKETLQSFAGVASEVRVKILNKT